MDAGEPTGGNVRKLHFPKIPLETIDSFSKVQRIIICVATFSLLIAGFYSLVYSPKSKEISELENEYSAMQVELAEARGRAMTLKGLKEDVRSATMDLAKAKELLPDTKEIPKLLESITSAGKSAGLEFLLFKPGEEVLKNFYAEIPVTIKVTGSYHNIAVFFDKISKLYRIVNVFDVETKGNDKGKMSMLTTTCTAKTYRFVEGSDAASGKEKKEKGK